VWCSVCGLGSDLLGVCFLGWVWALLRALSMLSKATFNVVKSDVYDDAALLVLGTEFQKKKGTSALAPSSTCCEEAVCVVVTNQP